MSPIIHCVRHAQGLHNLCSENQEFGDPVLTELGHKQCATLNESFGRQTRIGLVTASPLRRTIQTALESFETVFKARPEMRLIALPDVQENSDKPCDTGSDLEILQEEFGRDIVDLGLVFEGWNNKREFYAPIPSAIKERARAARRWFKARPEREIILVSHGGFLHYFTEDWEDSQPFQGTGWKNTEYRTYTFSCETHQDNWEGYSPEHDNATLIETSESRVFRGKEGPALDAKSETQQHLYEQYVQGRDNGVIG